jgi:exopolyphosphatase/guanosine-5'-triphosphate,3'-diphosphate pyrophosphatase
VLRACIDIGSNTTRLLVAECQPAELREVHQERVFTHVGDHLRGSGRLDREKVDEVATVVAAQLAHARALGCVDVRCVGTAALRRAANRDELVARIAELCGLPVAVLSEADEARLAFLGAAATLEVPAHGPLAVVDVGGGSSELAIGEPPAPPAWWVSLPLGSADLADAYFTADSLSSAQLNSARAAVGQALRDVHPPPAALAVAVGGSATSLRRLVGRALDQDSIRAVLEAMTSLSTRDVAERFALHIERVRLVPAALVILEGVSALVAAPLELARGGLREGILLERSR